MRRECRGGAGQGGAPQGARPAPCGGHSRSPAARMTYLGLPPLSEHDSRTTRCRARGSNRPSYPKGASSAPIRRTPCANSARQKLRPSAARECSTSEPHGGMRTRLTGPRQAGQNPAAGHARAATGSPQLPPHASHASTASRPRASSSSKGLSCASPARSTTWPPRTCCGPGRRRARPPAGAPPCPAAARPPRRPVRRRSPPADAPSRAGRPAG